MNHMVYTSVGGWVVAVEMIDEEPGIGNKLQVWLAITW